MSKLHTSEKQQIRSEQNVAKTMKSKTKRQNPKPESKTKKRKAAHPLHPGRHPTPTNRPTPNECRHATTALSNLHPHVTKKNDVHRQTWLESCGRRSSVIDSVVSTMLSQNTTEANSTAAFSSLKKAYPTWDHVADCDDLEAIEAAVRVAGLAKTRARRIRDLVRTVREERGGTLPVSMEYIRGMTDDGIKRELGRFKGLGPKTISCVLLFALGRDEFPVDTHVLRISQKLGWVPVHATREGAYEHLNQKVPKDVKLDLHCLLVAHGKRCHKCAANGRPQFPAKDGSKLKCPLVNLPSISANIAKGREDAGSGVKKDKVKVEHPGECVNTIGKRAIKQEADVNESSIVKQEANVAGFNTVKQEANVIGSHEVKQESSRTGFRVVKQEVDEINTQNTVKRQVKQERI